MKPSRCNLFNSSGCSIRSSAIACAVETVPACGSAAIGFPFPSATRRQSAADASSMASGATGIGTTDLLISNTLASRGTAFPAPSHELHSTLTGHHLRRPAILRKGAPALARVTIGASAHRGITIASVVPATGRRQAAGGAHPSARGGRHHRAKVTAASAHPHRAWQASQALPKPLTGKHSASEVSSLSA